MTFSAWLISLLYVFFATQTVKICLEGFSIALLHHKKYSLSFTDATLSPPSEILHAWFKKMSIFFFRFAPCFLQRYANPCTKAPSETGFCFFRLRAHFYSVMRIPVSPNECASKEPSPSTHKRYSPATSVCLLRVQSHTSGVTVMTNNADSVLHDLSDAYPVWMVESQFNPIYAVVN